MTKHDYEKWYSERKGKEKKRKNEYRRSYMIDECRVVHSFGFRRLQGKTQVLSGFNQGDFHRDRLTHSIEVASIARSIVAYLKSCKKYDAKLKKSLPDDNLITTIGLLHDIGHPPFGHGGEIALNFKMRDHEGFEGNAQTLRYVTNLDQSSKEYGLNLTRRTLLGILKYPVPHSKLLGEYPSQAPIKNRDIKADDWKPPKCFFDADTEIISWLLSSENSSINKELPKDAKLFLETMKETKGEYHKKPVYKSLDCSIMDIADDIAYSIHDLEDAIHLAMVDKGMMSRKFYDNKKLDLEGSLYKIPYDRRGVVFHLFDSEVTRKRAIGQIVHNAIQKIKIAPINKFKHPIFEYNVKFTSGMENQIDNLKDFIIANVIQSAQVQTSVFGGMMMIMQLFDAILADPKNLLASKLFRGRYKKDPSNKYRIVCDFIAGMTDEYAYRLHQRIYGGDLGSVFEKL